MDISVLSFLLVVVIIGPMFFVAWFVKKSADGSNASYYKELKEWQTLIGAVIAITMFLATQAINEAEGKREQSKLSATNATSRFTELEKYTGYQIAALTSANDYVTHNLDVNFLSDKGYSNEITKRYFEAKNKIPDSIPVDVFVDLAIGSQCRVHGDLIELSGAMWDIINTLEIIDFHRTSLPQMIHLKDKSVPALDPNIVHKTLAQILEQKQYTNGLSEHTINTLAALKSLRRKLGIWKARTVVFSAGGSTNMKCPEFTDISDGSFKSWTAGSDEYREFLGELIDRLVAITRHGSSK